ncbi:MULTISPECIES: NAD(P)/FAD-dependent oxidoreductase [unclassified Yoonia]|uniref:NAD(P)/FAD-dependent oxidoreductase n=1 Tax=unclassified Yoonia TaxID=2629118 RepID=UPI002AFE3BC7|nr:MULTISPECIES: NAD(P)/FAD-dependent oxidoreductase [unclassified Yoonia]
MKVQTLIIGAGAAGMMCAAQAGPGVLVVDHARAAGEKIRISGGGRCNFTNMHTGPEKFITQNRHFAKSALGRYTQWDFLALVEAHGIAWHEKTLGQLFCDTSAKDIVTMLRAEMERAGAQLWLQTHVGEIRHDGVDFVVSLTRQDRAVTVTARHLVMASGGKSIPKMGATGLAYQVAEQFSLPVITPRPGLVPLTFGDDRFKPLAGVATQARVTANGTGFEEGLLFTHRGLSGPAVLQASSYWQEGAAISLNLTPGTDLFGTLQAHRQSDPRKALTTILSLYLPGRLVDYLADVFDLTGNMADQSDKRLTALCADLQDWQVTPTGSEGYRTAEVTLGGVDTAALSSRTMAATALPQLYFIGECVDVTGWLGGYNFQWAWSSGWAAGQAIRQR